MKVEGFLYSVFLICIHCQQAFFFFLLTILVLIELKNGGAACLLSNIFCVVTGFSRPQCEILYKDNFERQCYNEFHRYTQIYKVKEKNNFSQLI